MKVVETRKIDSLGRVVLPIELRKQFDIDKNSDIDICVCDNQIIIKKSQPNCKICKSTELLKEFEGKNVFVCADCQQSISNL